MSRPTLILLPGLDGTGRLFEPLLRIIPPDRRSRAISYPHNAFLSYGDLLGVIEQQVRGEREMVLIAESFSGPLALRYAARNLDCVTAIILCASFIRAPAPRWLRFLAKPLVFRIHAPETAVRHFLVGRGATYELVQAVKDAIGQVRPHVLAGRVREVLDVDCTEALRQCTVPMLYLAAGQDALVRRASVEAIRAIRPDIPIRTIDGPHLILQREPAAAWREINQFLIERT